MKKTLMMALVAATCVATAVPAWAGLDGVWKCKASGNIPIALVTISGDSYEMQAVKNSVWAPKANDPANGSGNLNIDGNSVTPTSGPLADLYGAVGSYCGEGESDCSGESLMLNSTINIPLGCWRDG
jgi:hypothetical protein